MKDEVDNGLYRPRADGQAIKMCGGDGPQKAVKGEA